jgi:hypothetical protein
MYNPVKISKGRTTTLLVNLNVDLSDDDSMPTAQVRADKNPTSALLGTWVVNFVTDGVDGKLVLTMDNSQSTGVTRSNGYMDVKRLVGGEPLSAFDEPIPVVFEEVVTV